MSEDQVEKLKALIAEIGRKHDVSAAEVKKDIEYIKKEIIEIKQLVSEHYVTKVEFDPIKKIVYGIAGMVLVTVFGALLALII